MADALQPRRRLALGGADLRGAGDRSPRGAGRWSATGPGAAASSSRSTTPPRALSGMLQAPEGLLLVALLGEISALGLLWPPLLVAAPVVLRRASPGSSAPPSPAAGAPTTSVPGRPRGETLKRRAVTSLLFLLQPFARLAGRLRNGLSPWRRRAAPARPCPGRAWSRSGANAGASRRRGSSSCRTASPPPAASSAAAAPSTAGTSTCGPAPLGGVKIRTAVEEHGDGQAAAAGAGLAADDRRRAARGPGPDPAGAGRPAAAPGRRSRSRSPSRSPSSSPSAIEGMATATRLAVCRGGGRLEERSRGRSSEAERRAAPAPTRRDPPGASGDARSGDEPVPRGRRQMIGAACAGPRSKEKKPTGAWELWKALPRVQALPAALPEDLICGHVADSWRPRSSGWPSPGRWR